MPRRNSSPVNSSSRRRNSVHRRGTLLTAWDSTGKPIKLRVTQSNSIWTNVVDESNGERFVISTKRGM